jgi:cyclopropane-fatty-acyl-phospholipid synthase
MTTQLQQTGKSRIGASPEAISLHYDLSEEFFQLVIGPDLVYSCALFEDGDDLTAAQMRKLDHHIAASGAAGAARVLDVGCGWGALLRRLVQHGDVKQAVGLTLSPSQAKWIRQAALPGVEVREESWRDHKPDRRYGAIISIGAFEHFVHPGMSPAEKLDAYREFFAFCDRSLVSRGRLSLQTIAYTAPLDRIPELIPEKIFPESELPLLWEPIAAAEGRFELLALRNDREHYFRTLRLWDRNLRAGWDKAVALLGEAAVVDFRRYLRISAGAFQSGTTGLLRMSFMKVG